MKVIYAHACDYAAILSDSNPIISGIFQGFKSLKPAKRSFQVIFNTEIYRGETLPIKINGVVINPSDKEISRTEIIAKSKGIMISGEKEYFGAVLNFKDVDFSENGAYIIKLSIDDKPSHEMTIDFTLLA